MYQQDETRYRKQYWRVRIGRNLLVEKESEKKKKLYIIVKPQDNPRSARNLKHTETTVRTICNVLHVKRIFSSDFKCCRRLSTNSWVSRANRINVYRVIISSHWIIEFVCRRVCVRFRCSRTYSWPVKRSCVFEKSMTYGTSETIRLQQFSSKPPCTGITAAGYRENNSDHTCTPLFALNRMHKRHLEFFFFSHRTSHTETKYFARIHSDRLTHHLVLSIEK